MSYPAKATDAQLALSYSRTRSVWKTAEQFGMCGQSVHERLSKLGVVIAQRIITDAERARIREVYTGGFLRGDGALEALAKELRMDVTNVCREARRLGLTNRSRIPTVELSSAQGRTVAAHIAANGHPRGMLGKKHSEATRELISAKGIGRERTPQSVLQMLKTRVERHGNGWMKRPGSSWKAGWREIGGVRIYARSRWEANYARYLEFLRDHGEIAKWEHEPETFWFEKIKRGVRSYLPDFRVTFKDGRVEFHEVKGWMDARSQTKLKRMKKYHPAVVVRVIDADWFRANRNVRKIVEGWES